MTSYVTRGRGSVVSSNANSTDKEVPNGSVKYTNGKNNHNSSESAENIEMVERNGHIVLAKSEDESRPMMGSTVDTVACEHEISETQPILIDNNNIGENSLDVTC